MSATDLSVIPPQPPVIWVKRWELGLQMLPADADFAGKYVTLATPYWYPTDTVLPAVHDWPRWKDNGTIPPDEYYEVTYVPEFTPPACTPDGQVTGPPTPAWTPVWKRIPTPRAFRWVNTSCPPCAESGCCQ